MIKIRNVRIFLMVAVLVAFAMVVLLLDSPTQSAAAQEETNAPDAVTVSRAWVTSYDDEGGLEDITTVTCGILPGYQTQLSSYVGEVVNNEANSYVLNWRPFENGSNMQLCGLRVAYRLPLEGGGFRRSFSYYHAGGSALRPRDSTTEWRSDGTGGCLYQFSGSTNQVYNLHLGIPNGSRIDYLRIYCYHTGFPAVFTPLLVK